MRDSNKTLKKWCDLIDKKGEMQNAPFSEHEIIYLRKAIGPSGIKESGASDYLYDYFYDNKPHCDYNITTEHGRKGIEYLLKNTFKKNGNLRKNNIFNEYHINIIKDYSFFTFSGLYNVGNGYMLPLYKCYDSKGNYFEYTGNVYECIVITGTGLTNLKLVA